MRSTPRLAFFSFRTLAAAVFLALAGATVALADANYLVTSTNDAGAGTLRDAITQANTAGGTKSIGFDATVFALAGAPYTIQLATALPDVTCNLAIVSPGANVITVRGSGTDFSNNPTYRLFTIHSGSTVTLSNLTFTNFAAGGANGVTPPANSATLPTVGTSGVAGVIYNSGSLTVRRCVFSGNSIAGGSGGGGAPNVAQNGAVGADGFGGAIYSDGAALSVDRCTFSNNLARGGSGGGGGNIQFGGGGSGSGAAGANGRGGAVYIAAGTGTFVSSTFAGNSANGGYGGTMGASNFGSGGTNNTGGTGGIGEGGAIYTTQPITVTSCSIGENRANSGNGGLQNNFTSNAAAGTAAAGGIYAGAAVTIGNTLVAGNTTITNFNTSATAESDVFGTFISQNFNLIGGLTGTATGFTAAADQVGTIGSPIDAKLDPLGAVNNGGALPTLRLRKGSPAVDKGKDLVGAGTDEVGNLRPKELDDAIYPDAVGGDGTDIGAFESQSLPDDIPVVTGQTYSGTQGAPLLNTNNFPATTIQLQATDGDNDPLTYSQASGTLPTGLTLHADGTLTGTPTVFGQFTLTFKANDGIADSAPATLHLNIAEAHSLIVTTDSDTTNLYDGLTTLREAITYAASGNAGANPVITFDPTVFASAKTITLPFLNGSSNALFISSSMTINGPAAGVTISGDNRSAAFQIYNFGGTVTVTISNVTIVDGSQNGVAGGGVQINNFGGAPTVSFVNCTFAANSSDNYQGGAIYNNGGTLSLSNCTLAGNHADHLSFGGGGGAIYQNAGSLALFNCTLTGNHASGATTGGGIKIAAGTATLANTIVAGNTAGSAPDISGAITNQGYSIIGDTTGATVTGTVTTGDPGLDPAGLAYNGGPVPTVALIPTGASVDQGKIFGGVSTDARGLTRPIDLVGTANAAGGDGSDIGAYEAQTASATLPPAVGTLTLASLAPTTVTLGATVASDGGSTVTARGILISATSVNSYPQLGSAGVTNLPATGTTGVFTVPVTGLTDGTAYSYVAYAVNAAGTRYTSVGSFTTISSDAKLSAFQVGNVNNYTPNFSPSITDYFGFVTASTANTPLCYIQSENSLATVVVNGRTMVPGDNNQTPAIAFPTAVTVITAVVTAQDGVTTKTYTFTIERTNAPTVVSPTAINPTTTTATAGGNVLFGGYNTFTERGVVYALTSVNPSPAISGTGVTKVVAAGSGTTGVFTVGVSGLTPNVNYSYVAYATNASGTGYSSVVTVGAPPPPSISGVTGPANGTYKAGDALNFTVTFTSAVNVTGTPTLALTIGGVSRTATYVSGTGTTALVFTYTVQLGDNAASGITVTSPLSLAGGTLRDGSNLDAVLTFSPPSTGSVLVSTVPVVTTSGGNTAFVEADNVASTPVAVDAALTVTDPSQATLASGAVSITGNFQTGEDVLAFTNVSSTMGNIAGVYDGVGGGLTLTSSGGTATLAQWQAALRAVTYTDSVVTPHTANRTVSFKVNDAVQNSATVTKVVTVTGTDQSPVVTTSAGATSFLPGTAAAIDAAVTLSDRDNTAFPSATVSITGGYNAEDILAFTNDGTTMGNIAIATNTGGVLTLTSSGGTATTAQWQHALASVTYNDLAALPVTVDRTLSFVVNDGTKSSAAGTKTVSFIAPVVPTITWATPAPITYGTPLSLTQLNATATVGGTTIPGAFVYNYGIGSIFLVGAQTLSLTFAPANLALYGVATDSVTVTVTQAAPTITWAAPAGVTYGTALSASQLNAVATYGGVTVPGSYAYTPALGTIPSAGTRTLSVTFTPTDHTTYTTATTTVNLTVAQVTPVVTWHAPTSVTYGTALSVTQLNASAAAGGVSIAGTFTYSPASGAVLATGLQPLSVTFTPTDATDYVTVGGSTTLTVNQATPTIVWATPAAITYGTALSGTQLNAGATANGTSVAGMYVYTPASGVLGAGTQTLNVAFTPTDTTNYKSVNGSTMLTVNQAAQTITFPALTGVLIGVPVTLSATASSGLTPVTFVVTGNATLSNPTPNGATLTVNSANSVIVTASQAGNANVASATALQTITAAVKKAQTITFAAIANQKTSQGSLTLGATSDSGLTVAYTVNGTPMSGNILPLSTIAGTVYTVVASQAGDATYQPAVPVTQSFTMITGGQLTFNGTTGSGGLSDDSGSRVVFDGIKLHAVAASNNIAASLDSDGTHGTLIGFLPSTGQGFVITLTPDTHGNYSATTTTMGGTAAPIALTITGVATVTGISGTIQPLGLTFGATPDPVTGPTAALSGIYQSPNLNGSSGTTYSVVGTQGEVFVLVVTPAVVATGTGTVNATSGAFNVQTTQAVTIAGTVNAATSTVTGTVSSATGGTVGFSGSSNVVSATKVLVNMSARGFVQPSSPLIVGFVLSGTVSKTVVLRGVGPGLTSFGLTNALLQPQLTLYNASGAVVATNATWGGTAALSSAFTQVGAFGLASASADTALKMTLAPGPYTIVIADAANDNGGTALAEIYDASIDPSETTQKLVNISSRGQVTPANPLIGGFVVSGNTPKKVLIRAVGPGLAAFNVTGVLANPTLTVDDISGNALAQNDDWGTPQTIATGQSVASASDITAADTAAGAFPLVAGSKDAAIIMTLAPGNYSAVVSGVGNTSGAALVEVYELP